MLPAEYRAHASNGTRATRFFRLLYCTSWTYQVRTHHIVEPSTRAARVYHPYMKRVRRLALGYTGARLVHDSYTHVAHAPQ